MEAQIEFKKWLNNEIDRVKGFANSEILSFEERLEYFNQSSALMNAKIKLQELELEETNQQIESIIHYATNDGITVPATEQDITDK